MCVMTITRPDLFHVHCCGFPAAFDDYLDSLAVKGSFELISFLSKTSHALFEPKHLTPNNGIALVCVVMDSRETDGGGVNIPCIVADSLKRGSSHSLADR